MNELFLLIREYLISKVPVVLVTVTESSGSVPRGAGARMLVGKGPGETTTRLWGTIGGGLPEHLAIEEAGRFLRDAKEAPAAFSKKYLLHQNEAVALGLVCGGEISVFFRLMDAREPGLLEVMEEGISCIKDDKSAWFVMETSEHSSYPTLEIAVKEDSLAGSFQKPFSEPLFSGSFVYVFGGGHVAQELVPLLAHLDFRCVVFDDREEFATKDIFPKAHGVILGDFLHIENYLTVTGKDYSVIITRGHQWDLEVWAFALNSPAAYIGIIGSKSKQKFVKEKLKERGFEDDAINAARVHAPIGLDIKSKTPAEIAVSIAAELILTRNKE